MKFAASAVAACDAVRTQHTGEANGREGTMAWYKQRLADKLFPGSLFTLLEAVYFLLMWKRTYRIGRQAMDSVIKLISTRMLPAGHILPPTLHMVQRVSGAEEWDQYEVHICGKKGCKGHAWDYIPRTEWREHRDDQCPYCKTPRFKCSKVTGETCWVK